MLQARIPLVPGAFDSTRAVEERAVGHAQDRRGDRALHPRARFQFDTHACPQLPLHFARHDQHIDVDFTLDGCGCANLQPASALYVAPQRPSMRTLPSKAT